MSLSPEDITALVATGAALTPVENIKKTFGDIWDLVIGIPVGKKADMARLDTAHEVDKRQLKYACDLEEYRQMIEQKLNAIPMDRIIEADLSTVGPALEDSRYYIGREKLRKRFSNLIARACDRQYVDQVHPGFVDVLRQLSPLEAEVLEGFRPKKLLEIGMSVEITTLANDEVIEHHEPKLSMQPICYHFPKTNFPIVEYILRDNKSAIVLQKDVLLRSLDDSVNRMSACVANLRKLGLIETNYDASLPNNSEYLIFIEHPWYKDWNEHTDTSKAALKGIHGQLLWSGQFKDISIRKGYAELTQFGYDFITVCVLDEEKIMINHGE